MEVVKTAAAYVREQHDKRHSRGLVIEEKGKQNFVTEVDTQAEQILVSGLSALLPKRAQTVQRGSAITGSLIRWMGPPILFTVFFPLRSAWDSQMVRR